MAIRMMIVEYVYINITKWRLRRHRHRFCTAIGRFMIIAHLCYCVFVFTWKRRNAHRLSITIVRVEPDRIRSCLLRIRPSGRLHTNCTAPERRRRSPRSRGTSGCRPTDTGHAWPNAAARRPNDCSRYSAQWCTSTAPTAEEINANIIKTLLFGNKKKTRNNIKFRVSRHPIYPIYF